MIKIVEEETPISILNNDLPYNVYLYWGDSFNMGYESGVLSNDGLPLSHASTLISCQFAPYFDSEDFNIDKIRYDDLRYGYDGGITTYVHRIKSLANTDNGTIDKKLGSFTCYTPTKNIGGVRSWKNESKLYNYPYMYGYLFDGIGEPIEVKYDLCKYNTNDIYCRLALNINADYSLFIKGYLNDDNGIMTQNVISASRDYPCSSSQYAQWLATNKNQQQATRENAVTSAWSNTINSASSSLLSGDILGALGSTVGSGITGVTNVYTTKKSLLAEEKDMRNLPNMLISKGSDLTLGMFSNNKTLKLIKYRQDDDVMQKIGDYFAQYGYKQNKLMMPSLRSRKYYNYIKTLDINLESDVIPHGDLMELKNIFNNGVTIWHHENGKYRDYSMDNMEV